MEKLSDLLIEENKDSESLLDVEKKNFDAGENVYHFLNRTGFSDMRNNEDEFNEWISNLSYEDFLAYLTRLNGIVRENPINNRSMDGQNAKVDYGDERIAYLPPSKEVKYDLLKTSFESIKNIDNNLDRAILVYYVIQAIHPFSDGNGRVGRMMFELISSGDFDLQSLSSLLNHDKAGTSGKGNGRSIFEEKILSPNKAYYLINREVVKDFLGQEFLNRYGGIYVFSEVGLGRLSDETRLKLTQEEISQAEQILGEGDVYTFSFRGIVLSKLISENSILKQFEYENNTRVGSSKYFALTQDSDKEIYNIDGEIMNALDENHVRRLIEIHNDLKEKFIKTMIDIFENPKRHIDIDDNGSEYYIKDYFLK